MSRYILLGFALLLLAFVPASWGATVNVKCPEQSLQAAIDAAGIDTEIDITGTCNENILVDNNKMKVYLIGLGTDFNEPSTIINGLDPNKATLDVRGKAILINNLRITGGSDGIHVQRGSNAVIDSTFIYQTGNRGIFVSDLAFAVITNNDIGPNPGNGIQISTNSTAHIGFNGDNDAAASFNVIIQNGSRGILVEGASSARIYGNAISANGSDGVGVFRLSHADIASNIIDRNGQALVPGGTDGNGVSVSENSSVQLGEDNPRAPGTPGAFADQPNITTNAFQNNKNAGIRCTAGANVRGHLGSSQQLNGEVSQFGGGTMANTFSTSCPTAANALSIP